ncbi:MAG: ribosome biogenesis GTPase Der [Candidatus Gastranaerophilales bacterium]|nr:ribosome biogenesis GTPase Der [Candidatus Gastranaerophilales bacterium]
MKKKPTIAIVGRPNVGKSTFINRLIGSREAIVDDMPGVTRDRLYFDAEWCSKTFTVIDTGGIIPGDEDEIMLSIFEQAQIACEEADCIVFIVDAKEGITPVDEDIANQLRRTKKPVFLAVNKIDTPDQRNLIYEFHSLALGDPNPISAMHGTGDIGDLLDKLVAVLPEGEDEEPEDVIRLALIGKPNAGKSSLINAVLDKQRVIVSEVAGTTRDAIDTEFEYEGQKYVLVDTAGLRKKSKVEGTSIERYAVVRAIKTIRKSDIALLIVDANEGITDQDKKIADLVIKAGRGLIIVVNKWDIFEDKDEKSADKYKKDLQELVPFLKFAPILFVSAKTGQRIHKIFPTAKEVYSECKKQLSTSILNRVILEAYALNPPTTEKGKRLKPYYSTQIISSPPSFVIFVNDSSLFKESYKRYLEKKMREAFGFFGTPIRLFARERKEKKGK